MMNLALLGLTLGSYVMMTLIEMVDEKKAKKQD